MWSVGILALIAATFIFGGFVKGTLGLGLPVVALAFLAPTIGLKEAMAVMLLPCIIMNIWQARAGGELTTIVKRMWTYLGAACVGIWIGVWFLVDMDRTIALAVLGCILCVYSFFSLMTPQVSPPGVREPWASPLAGGVGGLAFGITGTFMVPGIMYLQALGMRRDMFVQALGVTFVVISSALAISMARHDLLPRDLFMLSALAVVPAALGLLFGLRIRHSLPESTFRKLFFVALFVVGVYMISGIGR